MMARLTLEFLAALGLSITLTAGEAAKPPFVGEVTGERVRVRGGDGNTYMVLAHADEGMRVNVKGERFGWYAIDVPESCTVWVHKSMLGLKTKNNVTKVARDRVNIRARAERTADILGQLPQGAEVELVDSDGEWAGIKPTPHARAWIRSKFVRKVAGQATEAAPPKRAGDLTGQSGADLLKRAVVLYEAELRKPVGERDFDAVLDAYQEVASKCADPRVARAAERARQRLLKIVDLMGVLERAEKPIQDFEKKYEALEEEYKRRAGWTGED